MKYTEENIRALAQKIVNDMDLDDLKEIAYDDLCGSMHSDEESFNTLVKIHNDWNNNSTNLFFSFPYNLNDNSFMHEPITQLQRALGDLESDIRYLQPDKLRWTHIRKELIDKLDWCKELARRTRDSKWLILNDLRGSARRAAVTRWCSTTYEQS